MAEVVSDWNTCPNFRFTDKVHAAISIQSFFGFLHYLLHMRFQSLKKACWLLQASAVPLLFMIVDMNHVDTITDKWTYHPFPKAHPTGTKWLAVACHSDQRAGKGCLHICWLLMNALIFMPKKSTFHPFSILKPEALFSRQECQSCQHNSHSVHIYKAQLYVYGIERQNKQSIIDLLSLFPFLPLQLLPGLKSNVIIDQYIWCYSHFKESTVIHISKVRSPHS